MVKEKFDLETYYALDAYYVDMFCRLRITHWSNFGSIGFLENILFFSTHKMPVKYVSVLHFYSLKISFQNITTCQTHTQHTQQDILDPYEYSTGEPETHTVHGLKGPVHQIRSGGMDVYGCIQATHTEHLQPQFLFLVRQLMLTLATFKNSLKNEDMFHTITIGFPYFSY